jgi:putative peptidoglycan lipid II flippase
VPIFKFSATDLGWYETPVSRHAVLIKRRFIAVAASATGVSVVSMGLALLRQLLIAAYFGVSRDLEIYLFAYSVANWVVFAFGASLDSVVVPHLVRIRESEGMETSRAFAAAIFRASCLLGLATGLLMIAVMPLLAPIMATGFSPAERSELAGLTWYFLPWAFFYLAYYGAATWHKSVWRFNRVFTAEITIGVVTVLSLVLVHDNVTRLPLAYAAGNAVGLLCLLPGAGLIRHAAWGRKVGDMLRDSAKYYFSSQTGSVSGLTDRHFQSLLPPGGIAAIGYASQLVTGLSSLILMREIFIVPLSSHVGRAEKLERLIIGLLLLSVPAAGITSCFAHEIVEILFQRGHFDAAAAELTAQVLRFTIWTLVATAITMPLYRMFTIIGRIHLIQVYFLSLALFYAVLGTLFIGWLDMGMSGIISMYLASSILSCIVMAWLIRRCGVALRWWRIGRYFLFALAVTAFAAAAALGGAAMASLPWERLLIGGPIYGLCLAAFYFSARSRLRRIIG